MAVDGFIALTLTKFNNSTVSRDQGVVADDIRFGTANPNGSGTVLWVEDRSKADNDKLIVTQTPAQILAAVQAAGYTQNKLQVLTVTTLKHGASNVYTTPRSFLLNSEFMKQVVTLPAGGSGFFYHVEEHKTPWYIEVEESLIPSDTATSTTTG